MEVLGNSIEIELGAPAESSGLHVLRTDEWIFLDQHSVDAGLDVPVYSNLAEPGDYRVGVYDGEDQHVATLSIALDIPAPTVARELATPEFGTSLPPVGILSVPADMPGGMYTLDKKYAFFVSRSATPSHIAVLVPMTTMHFFNTAFGYNFYTKSYLESGRIHPFSARRPLPVAIAARNMWIDGFQRWCVRGLGDRLKVSFVPDTLVGDYHMLRRASVLIVVGRSEYWLRGAREVLDMHIQEGKHALFLTGETMYVEAVSSDCGDRYDVARPDRYWGRKQSEYPLLTSIGPNPFDGGILSVKSGEEDPGFGVFRVVADAPPLAAAGLREGDTIDLPTTAYDGLPLDGYDDDGAPIISADAIAGFDEFRLLAWAGGQETPKGTIGAFCAFRPAAGAGICVHAASMAWSKVIGASPPTPESTVAERVVESIVATLVEGRGAMLFEHPPEPEREPEPAPAAEAVPAPTNGASGAGEPDPVTTNAAQCNLCGTPVSEFRQHLGKPRSCPTCGSNERGRTFVAAYSSGALGVDLTNKKMLLVSPSTSELRFLREVDGLELVTLDIRPVVKPDIVADLCEMPEVPDAHFDFVYASCVLNCTYDVDAALSEIHRVLTLGGSFLNVEMLIPNKTTVERTDMAVVTQYYGSDDYEKYRVGGHRSFGELDYPEILGRHFEHVERRWVVDLPYGKGQWWHVASRGEKRSVGAEGPS